MQSVRRDAGPGRLAVTAFATVAAIVWGPGWLPFVIVAIGAAWFVQSRPDHPKLGTAVLAGLLALAAMVVLRPSDQGQAFCDNAGRPGVEHDSRQPNLRTSRKIQGSEDEIRARNKRISGKPGLAGTASSFSTKENKQVQLSTLRGSSEAEV